MLFQPASISNSRRRRKVILFSLTCIPLNALSDNLRMVLNEKSSFVIGKFADVNVYFMSASMVRESVHYPMLLLLLMLKKRKL